MFSFQVETRVSRLKLCGICSAHDVLMAYVSFFMLHTETLSMINFMVQVHVGIIVLMIVKLKFQSRINYEENCISNYIK